MTHGYLLDPGPTTKSHGKNGKKRNYPRSLDYIASQVTSS